MNNYIECRVVMLPTNENSRYGDLTILNGHLLLLKMAEGSTKKQHLYFTSDEPIKEGDWFLDTRANSVDATQPKYKIHKSKNGFWKDGNPIGSYKLVASTDVSLGLPTIPESFIQKYVAGDSKIDKVRLEMIMASEIPCSGQPDYDWCNDHLVIKLTANNEVVVVDEPASESISLAGQTVNIQVHPVDKELEDAAKNGKLYLIRPNENNIRDLIFQKKKEYDNLCSLLTFLEYWRTTTSPLSETRAMMLNKKLDSEGWKAHEEKSVDEIRRLKNIISTLHMRLTGKYEVPDDLAMVVDQRIAEQAAEDRYKTVPEKTKWICKDAFVEGAYWLATRNFVKLKNEQK